jgi:hypothetical protein
VRKLHRIVRLYRVASRPGLDSVRFWIYNIASRGSRALTAPFCLPPLRLPSDSLSSLLPVSSR